jgi:hypothetical protein
MAYFLTGAPKVARSRKLLKREDLRGKTKMAEMLIDV